MKRFALALALAAVMAVPVLADNAPKSCCAGMDSVTKQVTNLDNGVRITMTAKDPKVVAKLQECMGGQDEKGCCKDCPMHDKAVTRKVEKTVDGIVITATTADATLAKKLQEHSAGKGCSHEMTAKDGKSCPHHGDGAQHGTTASMGKGCPMGGEHHDQAASTGPATKKCCTKEGDAKACAKPATAPSSDSTK
jgi:hypothetical protein